MERSAFFLRRKKPCEKTNNVYFCFNKVKSKYGNQ